MLYGHVVDVAAVVDAAVVPGADAARANSDSETDTDAAAPGDP